MPQTEPVVVVGAGLSGIATALGLALGGRPVTVVEAADQVGGAASYSGGQVWVGANHVARREGIDDDTARTEQYVRGISRAYPELLDEPTMQRFVSTAPVAMKYWEDVGAVRWTLIRGLADYHADVDGALSSGRYLTTEPVDGALLGEWRDRLLVSPYFRMGKTYADMFVEGRRGLATSDHPEGETLTLGTGLVAGFLWRALKETRIELALSTRVTELVRESDGRVVGVRARTVHGGVERRGPVVLATSTYDWDPGLVEEFLGLDAANFASLAPRTLRGDAIKLARSIGAAVASIPATCVPMVPGWRSGGAIENGPEYAMPHAMIVDRAGRRFCNDSYWPDIVPKALDATDTHIPFFLIVDEQHHRKYGLGATPPGGAYPKEVHTAPTLRDLGKALGVDGEQLDATAAAFNEHAAHGADPDFGRGTVDFINRFSGDPSHSPSPVLGPINEPPFHGLRLILLGTGIGSTGVHIDADGHVLDETGQTIPGLYAVGSCAATTTFGSGYNSGMALSRGLTLAYLVAQELSGGVTSATTAGT